MVRAVRGQEKAWQGMKKIVLAASVLALGSLMARAEVTNLSCTQTGPNECTLSSTLTNDSRAVQIFASTNATGANRREAILKTSNTEVTVHAGSAGERSEFLYACIQLLLSSR